ncbi:MAG: hypothetical protein WDM91_14385 [Rhizomicrobium sp.]
MKRDVLTGAALAALLLAPLPVLAADPAGEIVTASTHADLAAKAGDLAGTQMHLHHALNCLVGPGGAGFDAKSLNPCANAGAGAIPDTADAGKKATLEAAADTARAGLAAPDLATAHKKASDAAATLMAIK